MAEIQERGRTKIVATVGPASRSEEMLTKLVQAGVDVFRLNMAHASLDEHTITVERIRRVREAVGRPVAILVDLAGPKIRLGTLFEDPLECPENGELTFVRGETAASAYELVSNYEPLLDELSVGDSVVLADGVVGLKVTAKTADRVTCRVTEPAVCGVAKE
ncbi:MAG: pyruvate kinase [Planctomycetota bacterium]|nr:pyruvate kinase [Planctomycetota bacterium]